VDYAFLSLVPSEMRLEFGMAYSRVT
jgi:hypothetical protein